MSDILDSNGQPTGMQPSMAFATNLQELEALENAEAGPSLAPRYFKFEQPGQTLRGIFCGLQNVRKTQNGQTNWMTVVVIQNKDGVWLNAGANLLPQFDHVPQGAPVEIKFTGKQQTKSGNTVFQYVVTMLRATVNVALTGAAPSLTAPQSQPALPMQAETEEEPTVQLLHSLDPWVVGEVMERGGYSKEQAIQRCLAEWGDAGVDKRDITDWLASLTVEK